MFSLPSGGVRYVQNRPAITSTGRLKSRPLTSASRGLATDTGLRTAEDKDTLVKRFLFSIPTGVEKNDLGFHGIVKEKREKPLEVLILSKKTHSPTRSTGK